MIPIQTDLNQQIRFQLCTTSNRHGATETIFISTRDVIKLAENVSKSRKKKKKVYMLHTIYVDNLLSDGNVAVEIPFVGVKNIGSIFMDDSESDRKRKNQNKWNIWWEMSKWKVPTNVYNS